MLITDSVRVWGTLASCLGESDNQDKNITASDSDVSLVIALATALGNLICPLVSDAMYNVSHAYALTQSPYDHSVCGRLKRSWLNTHPARLVLIACLALTALVLFITTLVYTHTLLLPSVLMSSLPLIVFSVLGFALGAFFSVFPLILARQYSKLLFPQYISLTQLVTGLAILPTPFLRDECVFVTKSHTYVFLAVCISLTTACVALCFVEESDEDVVEYFNRQLHVLVPSVVTEERDDITKVYDYFD